MDAHRAICLAGPREQLATACLLASETRVGAQWLARWGAAHFGRRAASHAAARHHFRPPDLLPRQVPSGGSPATTRAVGLAPARRSSHGPLHADHGEGRASVSPLPRPAPPIQRPGPAARRPEGLHAAASGRRAPRPRAAASAAGDDGLLLPQNTRSFMPARGMPVVRPVQVSRGRNCGPGALPPRRRPLGVRAARVCVSNRAAAASAGARGRPLFRQRALAAPWRARGDAPPRRRLAGARGLACRPHALPAARAALPAAQLAGTGAHRSWHPPRRSPRPAAPLCAFRTSV
jgi:hypothetical protein